MINITSSRHEFSKFTELNQTINEKKRKLEIYLFKNDIKDFNYIEA